MINRRSVAFRMGAITRTVDRRRQMELRTIHRLTKKLFAIFSGQWLPLPSGGCRHLATAMLLTASVLTGCARYTSRPLKVQAGRKALSAQLWQKIPMRIAKLRVPWHLKTVLHPNRGLTAGEASILALVLNPNLKALMDQRGIAAAQLLQAGLLSNPALSENTNFVTGGYRTDTFTGYGLGLSWNVTQLIALQNRIAAAQYQKGAIDLSTGWQQWQYAMQARMAFWQYYAAESQLQQARLAYRALAHNEHIQRSAYAIGLSTLLDLSAAATSTQQAQSLELKLKQEARDAKLALLQVLGLPAYTIIHLRRTVHLPHQLILPPLHMLHDLMLTHRLDLAALRKGYQSQDQVLRQEVLDQFPQITIGFQQASDTTNVHTTGFGVSISLPIFDQNQGRIAIARATRRMLYDQYWARVFTARSQLDLAAENIRQLQQRIGAASRSIESLSRLEQLYAEALKQGNADVVTYYHLVNTLISQRIRLIKLRSELEDNFIALELSAGVIIPRHYHLPRLQTSEHHS
jgi:cobalt-zinc-cadmium efflux system outer membrane protein